MDTTELRDLLAAWILLSVAFANLLGDLFNPVLIGVAFLTVGVGFFLHEMAHRAVARKFGLHARFKAFYNYLGLAVLLSFAGFIFAAPGAVYTHGSRTGRQQMLISVAGPVTNIVLGVLFFFVPGIVGNIGYNVNVWLAMFNMIPFGGLDGQSVLKHNKLVYAVVVVAAAALYLLV